MKTYTNPVFPYRRPAELDGARRHYPVIVVGAGPVGLAAAIDLAQRQIPVIVLDEDDTVSVGSRAICYAKRALEILDRLGCAEPILHKGVRWSVGKVFHRDELVYQFDLLPETGHRHPAFVNLQQYHLEECLVAHASTLPAADLRWKNKVVGVHAGPERVDVQVACPDGEYAMSCDWLIAADGARSPVRGMLGLEAAGQVFRDRFLIADIHMQSSFPTERWFWFDPPFHPNQSVLLHRQADDIWRIDFQLGWDADPELEKKPERILPRLRAMLGTDARFEIEWASVYTFSCRRMPRFRHGRVIFVGDAAHLLSPFGARGANSGFQDVDNLAWKLDLVIKRLAPEALLDSYDVERGAAADENIVNSTRSTDFITPKSAVSRTFRDAVLGLAKQYPFARKLVNSGRLSVPRVHTESPLNTRDDPADVWSGGVVPGAPAADAPVRGPKGDWLLNHVGGAFTLLVFDQVPTPTAIARMAAWDVPCEVHCVTTDRAGNGRAIADVAGLVRQRYDATTGSCYLFRPDQILCARWRTFDVGAVRAAMDRALARAAATEEVA